MTCPLPHMRITTVTCAAAMAILLATGCSESTPVVSPLPAAIRTIEVSASKSSLVVGDSVEVRATATADDGYPFHLTTVGWTSSDSAIATVTPTGPLTAQVRTISAGLVSITATVESHSGYLALAVTIPATPPSPPQISPSLAFIWSAETGMLALTFPPGVSQSSAGDVNDLGQVVGTVTIDSRAHAFVWTVDGGMTDIGGLPGFVSSYATAINNAGQVVGASINAAGRSQAFRWSPSEGMIALPMPPGTESSVVRGINASGAVVGELNGTAGPILFRWSQEKGTEDLTLFDADSYGDAVAIADNGDVVGYSGGVDSDSDVTRAVLWSANGTKKIIDPCTEGWIAWDYTYVCHSSAHAINNVGQIVVESDVNGASLAVRFTVAGDRLYIPRIPGSSSSYASAINDAGQVVGTSYWQVPLSAVGRAFFWSPISRTIDLGSLPGRQWSEATGINNHGQVVGRSY